MSRRPDAVTSSSAIVKGEPTDDQHVPPVPSSIPIDDVGDEGEDPIVRTIDVFISPTLSNTLHLLQFPIQPAVSSAKKKNASSSDNKPTNAKIRPKHNMLELEYPVPPSAHQGVPRPLPEKMRISQRTFTSNSIAPVTHMALAKLNDDGTRLDVVPMRKHVLQMRPSFGHLHDEEEDDANNTATSAAEPKVMEGKYGNRQRPIMFQKKETERSATARRNSYAYKKASEEGEEWIELDVHGGGETWSGLRADLMGKVKCRNRENELKLVKKGVDGDEGYVKSLNYLAHISGEGFVENLSDWAPSTATSAVHESTADGDGDVDMAKEATSSEHATAELASKLAVLLQNGNGTMIPYRVIRSRFNANKVSDEILTAALSSCAVLVRGNFALKSNLANFLNESKGGDNKKKLMMELRDLILLLLNMHGMVQRERLVRAYSAKAEKMNAYEAITADTITFLLKTVAKKSDDCWVAKVEDDEEFAAKFPQVATCHGVYWMKKKEMLGDLIHLYENAKPDK